MAGMAQHRAALRAPKVSYGIDKAIREASRENARDSEAAFNLALAMIRVLDLRLENVEAALRLLTQNENGLKSEPS